MKKYLILAVMLLGMMACTTKKHIVIISKDQKNYIREWLKSMDSTLIIKEFYILEKDSMDYYLKKTKGVVLSGGEDINPNVYHKPEYKSLCDIPDNFRDSIESVLIKYAMRKKVPVLGICRGHQILNVMNGGTLIPDIPTFKKESFIQHRSEKDSAHLIIPMEGSWIHEIFGSNKRWVNSRHHQCIDELAGNFMVAAVSPDSIIESIQIKDQKLHPFAIGVQWHPESLTDTLSFGIGRLFLEKVYNRKATVKLKKR